ncbi:MAG: MBL fold metallo-hydrolase [Phycisphaeraceae bacterium]|nr:MBL fold metallo-hydrolase [Phycisphaeraceae bacterium]
MKLQCFTLGDWMTNCYLVSDGDLCWIVDAGFQPQPLLDAIQQQKLQPQAVVLTHAHVDHIAGLHEIRDRYPQLPILIHDNEREFLTDAALNLSLYFIDPFVGPEATGSLAHGQQLTLGNTSFEIRHTPGHSPGNVCLYQKEAGVALVGDTLFADSIGRSDFPTSNPHDLIKSIHEQLLTMPDDTRVLPGHGPETTIGRERRHNPFL